MSAWRRKALDTFPERRHLVVSATSSYILMLDLAQELREAYRVDPPDSDLITRVYTFVEWCFAPTQNPDLRNAAAVSFYETLPDFEPARRDLARRFTPTMWRELQPLFCQVLSASGYAALVRELPKSIARLTT